MKAIFICILPRSYSGRSATKAEQADNASKQAGEFKHSVDIRMAPQPKTASTYSFPLGVPGWARK